MLEEANRKGFEHVVSWLSCGKAFRVHDTDRFVNEIMPSYFNQTKYKSFQRQLNMYGFHRFITGHYKGACSHPLFARDSPEGCRSMSRAKTKRIKKGQNNTASTAKSRQSPQANQVAAFSVLPGTAKSLSTSSNSMLQVCSASRQHAMLHERTQNESKSWLGERVAAMMVASVPVQKTGSFATIPELTCQNHFDNACNDNTTGPQTATKDDSNDWFVTNVNGHSFNDIFQDTIYIDKLSVPTVVAADLVDVFSY